MGISYIKCRMGVAVLLLTTVVALYIVTPARGNHRDHIYKIESLLYITANIHGMEPFGLILAPQPI
jgi:hypothetical protein